MKTLTTVLAALAFGAGAALADPVAGTWRTAPGDTGGYLHVEILPCGEAIFGVIRRAFDKVGQVKPGYAHLNKRMLWDMRPEGGGAYGDGRIWAFDRGKTCRSKMRLDGGRLEVEGCVLVICRGQTRRRGN